MTIIDRHTATFEFEMERFDSELFPFEYLLTWAKSGTEPERDWLLN